MYFELHELVCVSALALLSEGILRLGTPTIKKDMVLIDVARNISMMS